MVGSTNSSQTPRVCWHRKLRRASARWDFLIALPSLRKQCRFSERLTLATVRDERKCLEIYRVSHAKSGTRSFIWIIGFVD